MIPHNIRKMKRIKLKENEMLIIEAPKGQTIQAENFLGYRVTDLKELRISEVE